jgi:hypothetical protein
MELRMVCKEGINYQVELGFPNTWDTFAMVLTLCHSGNWDHTTTDILKKKSLIYVKIPVGLDWIHQFLRSKLLIP